MDEVLLSEVEDLIERMFDIEHHLFDPAQGSGNLQEVILDHGEHKVDVGFNAGTVKDLDQSVDLKEFSEDLEETSILKKV